MKAVTTSNSRDRGRHYRERLKRYQHGLEQDVIHLRKHVRDLELLATLQRRLVKCAKPTAARVVRRVHDMLSFQGPEANGMSPLRFHVDSFEVLACSDAPVVQLRGFLRGTLPHAMIHALYFCVPGNSALLDALLDRSVGFATTRTLFFGSDGSLVRTVNETDYVSALSAFARNASDWSGMLLALQGVYGPSDSGGSERGCEGVN